MMHSSSLQSLSSLSLFALHARKEFSILLSARDDVMMNIDYNFSLGCTKTLNKKKWQKKRKKKKKNHKNGEHTIRPVALVGGGGVRSRRFCFIVVVVVKKIIIGVECVYYVVEEVSLFEECDKKRGEYVRR